MKISRFEGSDGLDYDDFDEGRNFDRPTEHRRVIARGKVHSNRSNAKSRRKNNKSSISTRVNDLNVLARQVALPNQVVLKQVISSALSNCGVVPDGHQVVVPAQFSYRFAIPKEMTKAIRKLMPTEEISRSSAISLLNERTDSFTCWTTGANLPASVGGICIRGASQDQTGYRIVGADFTEEPKRVLALERRQYVKHLGISRDVVHLPLPLILTLDENIATSLGDELRNRTGIIGSELVFEPASPEKMP